MGKENWIGAIVGLAGSSILTAIPQKFPQQNDWLFYGGGAVFLVVFFIAVMSPVLRKLRVKPEENKMAQKFTLFKLADEASIQQATALDISVRGFEEVEGISAGKNAAIGTATFERFVVDASKPEKPDGSRTE
ncbi:MAG: hypothetical protein ACTHNN_02200 [Xanthobacteraceae bacterium]